MPDTTATVGVKGGFGGVSYRFYSQEMGVYTIAFKRGWGADPRTGMFVRIFGALDF